MSSIKFTGEVVQEGPEFVIKIELRMPSEDKALAMARWLNETIVDHVKSKGATISLESPLISLN